MFTVNPWISTNLTRTEQLPNAFRRPSWTFPERRGSGSSSIMMMMTGLANAWAGCKLLLLLPCSFHTSAAVVKSQRFVVAFPWIHWWLMTGGDGSLMLWWWWPLAGGGVERPPLHVPTVNRSHSSLLLAASASLSGAVRVCSLRVCMSELEGGREDLSFPLLLFSLSLSLFLFLRLLFTIVESGPCKGGCV